MATLQRSETCSTPLPWLEETLAPSIPAFIRYLFEEKLKRLFLRQHSNTAVWCCMHQQEAAPYHHSKLISASALYEIYAPLQHDISFPPNTQGQLGKYPTNNTRAQPISHCRSRQEWISELDCDGARLCWARDVRSQRTTSWPAPWHFAVQIASAYNVSTGCPNRSA